MRSCLTLLLLYMPSRLTYHGHPLADVVEVEHGQEVVGHLLPHLHDADGLGGAGAEHKAEVPGGRDQSALVRRLGLVVQLS